MIDAEQRGIKPGPPPAAVEDAPMRPPSFVPLALQAPAVEGDRHPH